MDRIQRAVITFFFFFKRVALDVIVVKIWGTIQMERAEMYVQSILSMLKYAAM